MMRHTHKTRFLLVSPHQRAMRGSNSYLAAIHRHLWPELTPSFEDLSIPGTEAHSSPGRGAPWVLLPHCQVQTVDCDVLCPLRAEQVQEIHLDPANSKLHLWGRCSG